MGKKILLYSDCFVYSGSENVIETLLSSKLSKEYEIVFYYAYSKRYYEGVAAKLGEYSTHPLKIVSAFNKWGYTLYGLSKRNFYYYYILFRYGLSIVFRSIGVHNIWNSILLYQIYKKQKPNILYINNGGYPGAASCRVAAVVARIAGISNVIFHVNNIAQPQRNLIQRMFDRIIDRSVKIFVTASEAAKRKLSLERRFDAKKCISIPNTLTEKAQRLTCSLKDSPLRKEFKIDDNTVIIGTVGLLTKRKGFAVLLEAAKNLGETISKDKKFCFIIFGDGEMRDFLNKKIEEYGLQKFFFIPGFRTNVMEYMKAFDVFVLPSIENEDFPYVIIEAMMLKKPIIGTNVAGIPEQIENGVSGYVVAPGDYLQLANKLEILIKEQPLRLSMGKKAFERYTDKFSNSVVIDRFEEVFKTIKMVTN